MAKKVRTPKPPRSPQASDRRVQTPQRRSGPAREQRSGSSLGARRGIWLLGALGVALVAVAIAVPVALTGGSSKTKRALTHAISWGDLPGLQTSAPPWPANSSGMTTRLSSIGLNPLGQEGLAFHIHQHLDVYVNGEKVAVPRFIGIEVDPSTNRPIYTELHTHDGTGLIHVESPEHLDYTLDQVFGLWGVKLTKDCLGRYCGNVGIWVNGKPYLGNPHNLVLKPHQEIVVAYGKPPANLPKSYSFPANT